MALRGLEQRPEQPRQPHRGEILQRKAVEEGLVRQFEEVAGAGAPGVVDQDVAALEALLDAGEHLLAAGELAQIARDRQRLGGPAWRSPCAAAARLSAEEEASTRLRAFARERRRNAAADAAAAA